MSNQLPADCELTPCPGCRDWQAMAFNILASTKEWDALRESTQRGVQKDAAIETIFLIRKQLRQTIDSAGSSFLAVPKKPEQGAMDAE